MPGLDPEIAVHRLNIKPDAKPIKQAKRRQLNRSAFDKKAQENGSNEGKVSVSPAFRYECFKSPSFLLGQTIEPYRSV